MLDNKLEKTPGVISKLINKYLQLRCESIGYSFIN